MTQPAEKICYLMRGLPSCGKSFTAKKLAGTTGLICETDDYFHTQVGSDPTQFNFKDELMDEARRWNLARFKKAIDEGITPVIVDRGNSLSLDSKEYAQYAVQHGYKVELKEPDSEWWQEIRVLLKHKKYTMPVLEKWAEKLSQMNRTTHRVPASTILRWMSKWRWDVTITDILNYNPAPSEGATDDAPAHSASKAKV